MRFIQQSESAYAFQNAEVQEVLSVFATDERGVARRCEQAVLVLHPEVAGYFRLRKKSAEVLVSGLVFCIESARTVVHAQFSTDNRVESRSLGRLEKWHGGMEVGIADSHGLAARLCGDFDNALGREQRFHETIAGAEMQHGRWGLQGSSDRNLRWFFCIGRRASAFAEPQVMPSQYGSTTVEGSDFIHRLGGSVERGGILCRGNEWQLRKKRAFVEIRELQRNKAQAHAALPSFFQKRRNDAIGHRLQVGWFIKAAAAQTLLEIIVSHAHADGPRCLPLRTGLGKEPVGHRAQHGQNKCLVGGVGLEGLLLGIGFCGRRLCYHWAFVDAIGEFPKRARVFSCKKRELLRRRACNLADKRQACPAQRGGELWPDAGKPFIFEGGKKFGLPAGCDLREGIRFFPFARDLRDQFIRGDSLGECDAEGLAHCLADGFRDVLRRFFRVPP